MHGEEAEFLAGLGPERGTSPRASASVRIVMKATSSLHNEVTSRAALLPGRLSPLADLPRGGSVCVPEAGGVTVLLKGSHSRLTEHLL